jgi:YVTN family beta-propeller protein
VSTQAVPVSADFRIKSTIDVGPGPHAHIGYVKEAGQVWVSNTGGDTISVLDHATGELVDTWAIGAGPGHFSFDQGCKVGCVALAGEDAMAVIDPRTHTVLEKVPVGAGAAPLGTMPAFDRGLVYSLNQGNATLTAVEVERRQVAAIIPVGGRPAWGQPWGASYKPITKAVGKTYIVSPDAEDLTVFSDESNEVLTRVKLGRRPNRNAIFREHGNIYASNAGDDTVSVVNIATDEVVATIPVGTAPFRLLPVLAMSGNDEMWVLEAAGGITALSGTDHEVTRTIDVVDRPANWVVNTQRRLFVVGSASRSMTVIDLRADSVVGESRLEHDPEQGAISGLIYTEPGNLFILNADSTVSVLRDTAEG